MSSISLLGIPNDENSSALRGAAEAPPLIRHELLTEVNSSWSENGIDFSAPGVLLDHGDIRFDGAIDPWELIEREVRRAFAPGVSHKEPGGLSTRQVIDLIQSLNQPIVAADIVEFNPRCDVGNMTAVVAAKLLKEIGGMMIKTSRGSAQ